MPSRSTTSTRRSRCRGRSNRRPILTTKIFTTESTETTEKSRGTDSPWGLRVLSRLCGECSLRHLMSTIEVKVPDIGDFKDVPVIEVFVKPGDAVKAEDSLVTLESDKATMDVPAPSAGVVKELKVKVGDKVSEGSVILTLEAAAGKAEAKAEAAAPTSAP